LFLDYEASGFASRFIVSFRQGCARIENPAAPGATAQF